MTDHVGTIFGFICLGCCLLVMIFGIFIMAHCLSHLNEPQEAKAEAGIESIFSVAGPTHLVGFGFGAALCIISMSYVFKSLNTMTNRREKPRKGKHKNRLHFGVTETGKSIAAQMKRFSPTTKE